MNELLAVCEGCDAAWQRVELAPNGHADCPRCGHTLYRRKRTNLEIWMALLLASLFAFFIANLNPIVELHLRGEHTQATLWQAIVASVHEGVLPVAMLAALCAFVIPLTTLAIESYIVFHLMIGRRPPWLQEAMLALRLARPWGMTEVFMMAVLVAVVKLRGDAEVIPGAGIAGFAVLTVLMTFVATFDPEAIWQAAEKQEASHA